MCGSDYEKQVKEQETIEKPINRNVSKHMDMANSCSSSS